MRYLPARDGRSEECKKQGSNHDDTIYIYIYIQTSTVVGVYMSVYEK